MLENSSKLTSNICIYIFVFKILFTRILAVTFFGGKMENFCKLNTISFHYVNIQDIFSDFMNYCGFKKNYA